MEIGIKLRKKEGTVGGGGGKKGEGRGVGGGTVLKVQCILV